jgi:hypothetical protein
VAFKTLDPALAAKMVEGYTNELEPQRKALDAFYRNCICPKCKGRCEREPVQGHVFGDPNVFVPRSCLRCKTCDCLFDPHSNIVLEMGDVPIR